jgi:hypothetical protein
LGEALLSGAAGAFPVFLDQSPLIIAISQP